MFDLLFEPPKSLYNKLMPFCDIFSLKRKIRPRTRSKKTLFFFYVLMGTIFAFFNANVYSEFKDSDLVYTCYILFTVSMILTTYLSILDPGYLAEES